ncbi:M20/M25/M40 family metallo-hydrolase [Deinococcus detaillensis]|uniref:M20/M25/M40 family metallo-hydrolase n=1 Tax=Deinococcus detaillensis TaxID=2592048 RepID=A0A553UZM5_9DEIO|nr:M20/M25/M40 family metallo-hydrolase [Deinococcus detaillensis]TSA85640.1 M20/M25/M40 family metallo-hydrolase [Deinococcus detaillensis]
MRRRAEDWTRQLVAQPSVTNTAGEGAFGPWLRRELLKLPYFAERPDQVWLEKTLHDPFERFCVCALVRGQDRVAATVLLTGHYDVVSVSNYGELEALAFSPDALAAALPSVLSAETDALALADLASGEYLFGRASLDMKSGLAAGLALLEEWAESGERGNLLFVAVPDEEENSHGMRSLVRQLPDIERIHELKLLCALNLDAEVDSGSGELGRSVFLGSVGKVLPTALLLGRPTHAGAPFDGVSAALLLAEVLRSVELHPDLMDPHPSEPGPPPVLLQLSDLKPSYDVTTPPGMWCAFNMLLRSRTPEQALAQFRAAVEAGMTAALENIAERARACGAAAEMNSEGMPTLTYAELLERVEKRGGTAALRRLEALARAAAPELDTPRLCQQLTLAAVQEAGLTGPAAVIGFGSLPYPAVELGQDAGSLALLSAVEAGIRAAEAQFGVKVTARPFFPGVSDMSFLSQEDPQSTSAKLLRANTPAWTVRMRLEEETGERLSLPVVNIGPWGRDYHQRAERVYQPYAFEVLPQLLGAVVRARLSAG